MFKGVSSGADPALAVDCRSGFFAFRLPLLRLFEQRLQKENAPLFLPVFSGIRSAALTFLSSPALLPFLTFRIVAAAGLPRLITVRRIAAVIAAGRIRSCRKRCRLFSAVALHAEASTCTRFDSVLLSPKIFCTASGFTV